MNPFEKQTDLLTRLAQLMVDQTSEDHDQLVGGYRYIPRFKTFGSSLTMIVGGRESSVATMDGFAVDAADICEELRAEMKGHTGGEWSSFSMIIDSDDRVNTKFDYGPPKDGLIG